MVEYKGAHLLADARDKKRIGERWERAAAGRGFFLMPTSAPDAPPLRDQIRAKIAAVCGGG